ncbi:PLD nuclease N-terminal domain-containing protein [Actinotalea sp. Marseille-Q4924]|uniref:PLD nuclease N-terminal domain-containing protein n=1 Tax=Actinotalea sp. Marseille-Q4924 TaxID=2866571 RepID=UPI001CE3F78D|nr:PLD nuclease N-terminal domain-containing protein [Actinotalea sp. Marseille-Q4924]
MGRVLVYVVPVALAIYAVIDLWRSRPEERAGVHPVLWGLIIVLVPVLGPVAWILTSLYLRSQQRAAGGPTRSATPPTRPGRPVPRRRPGPVAPDDDPDFLWRLERERRRREQGGPAGSSGAAGPMLPPDGGPTPTDAGDDDGPGGPSGRGTGRDAGAGKDDDGRG